jgi:hypothetical protein
MAAMSALALPVVASASGPGVDEYTLNIPGAGGNHPFGGGGGGGGSSNGGGPAGGSVGSLPGSVQAQLSGGPQGPLLGAVATSPALGAPQTAGHHQGNDGSRPGSTASPTSSPPKSSFSAAALRTVGDGASLLLLGAVIAVAALASGSILRLKTRRPA